MLPAVTAVAVLISARILFVTSAQLHSSVFFELHSALQAPAQRAAPAYVYENGDEIGKLRNKDIFKLAHDADPNMSAEIACGTFNTAGNLAREGMVDAEPHAADATLDDLFARLADRS